MIGVGSSSLNSCSMGGGGTPLTRSNRFSCRLYITTLYKDNLNSIEEHLEVDPGLYVHPEKDIWTQAMQFHKFGLDTLVGRGTCPGEFSP